MNHIDTTTENRDQQPLSAVNRIVPNTDGILPSFGKQLDALIKSKRIKNTKLADRTGISANVIAQYRRGKASCINIGFLWIPTELAREVRPGLDWTAKILVALAGSDHASRVATGTTSLFD